MKRGILILAAMLLLCLGGARAEEAGAYPVLETDVKGINKYGNLILSIGEEALLGQGFDYLDIIGVTVAGMEMEMPIVHGYTDGDIGDLMCVITRNTDADRNDVMLVYNMSDFAASYGIARKTETEDADGYRWEYLVPTPIEVTIRMKEKGGYAGEYRFRQLTRTCDRADYPSLTDEEYANFRAVTTPGIGQWTLYRSSSPVDPLLNRNLEADEALNNAGIRTVLNLTDTEEQLRGYEGYSTSYYSQRDVICLNMDLNFDKEPFKARLAEGLTFLAAHEGPYLVHCTEGKDRCGFVSAVLECLMGATAEEVFADYMVSYANYYGVEPGTDAYREIAGRYIRRNLETAFEVEDLLAADLSLEAEEYLRSAGLSDETIAAVKERLGRSCAE